MPLLGAPKKKKKNWKNYVKPKLTLSEVRTEKIFVAVEKAINICLCWRLYK